METAHKIIIKSAATATAVQVIINEQGRERDSLIRT